MTVGVDPTCLTRAQDRATLPPSFILLRECWPKVVLLTTPVGEIENDLHRVFDDLALVRRIIDRLPGDAPTIWPNALFTREDI